MKLLNATFLMKIWDNLEITGVDVPTGVSVQPATNEEAIDGALNRAKSARDMNNSDIGIGLEGNTFEMRGKIYLTGWAAVIDKNDKIGIGGGNSLELPEIISKEIRNGKELGPLMDKFTGTFNSKQKNGAIGFFTDNNIKRDESFEKMIYCALVKFMNPDYYEV